MYVFTFELGIKKKIEVSDRDQHAIRLLLATLVSLTNKPTNWEG
jgi:hypothetical protein